MRNKKKKERMNFQFPPFLSPPYLTYKTLFSPFASYIALSFCLSFSLSQFCLHWLSSSFNLSFSSLSFFFFLFLFFLLPHQLLCFSLPFATSLSTIFYFLTPPTSYFYSHHFSFRFHILSFPYFLLPLFPSKPYHRSVFFAFSLFFKLFLHLSSSQTFFYSNNTKQTDLECAQRLDAFFTHPKLIIIHFVSFFLSREHIKFCFFLSVDYLSFHSFILIILHFISFFLEIHFHFVSFLLLIICSFFSWRNTVTACIHIYYCICSYLSLHLFLTVFLWIVFQFISFFLSRDRLSFCFFFLPWRSTVTVSVHIYLCICSGLSLDRLSFCFILPFFSPGDPLSLSSNNLGLSILFNSIFSLILFQCFFLSCSIFILSFINIYFFLIQYFFFLSSIFLSFSIFFSFFQQYLFFLFLYCFLHFQYFFFHQLDYMPETSKKYKYL
ncbi:unnamed protein product [Acanthosepion pharaonis]|uniref:Uncharacterized protein n=1 Tax=Acanthosepion pharaonis TaxID=158019 RepID=A0A812DTV1_ACAPH|nr:unnamed protein product [Sepia pharaonis]